MLSSLTLKNFKPFENQSFSLPPNSPHSLVSGLFLDIEKKNLKFSSPSNL